jgi:hypothetical protein
MAAMPSNHSEECEISSIIYSDDDVASFEHYNDCSMDEACALKIQREEDGALKIQVLVGASLIPMMSEQPMPSMKAVMTARWINDVLKVCRVRRMITRTCMRSIAYASKTRK